MNLVTRIQSEVARIKENGDVPSIIWLGKEERKELETLIKDKSRFVVDNKSERMVCGVPFEFVSSESWLKISVKM